MAGADGGALPRSAKRRERVWARRLAAHQRVLVRPSHLPCHRVHWGGPRSARTLLACAPANLAGYGVTIFGFRPLVCTQA